MRIVSPLLKKVVYPALSRAGIFHQTSATGLAVVTYHGVLPAGYEPIDRALDGNLIGRDMLRLQLKLLKTHYQVIGAEELLAWRQGRAQLPERAVLITCDDGLLNCLTDMLPVLQQESLPCLFFVTGASAQDARSSLWYEDMFRAVLGLPNGLFEISAEGVLVRAEVGSPADRRDLWWDLVKRLSGLDAVRRSAFLSALGRKLEIPPARELDDEKSPFCRRYGLLTRSELQQIMAAGMSIGAHTISHPMLSEMARVSAYDEVANSRLLLESSFGHRVWAFAYPFGNPQSVTPEVLAIPEKAGYEVAFLNFGGGLGSRPVPYALPRVHVTADMNLAEFDAHVSGFYLRLQRLAGAKTQSPGMAQGLAS
jgi:peptidoglycan/xylan/chitin deacetylase (PgdA/CDA1 family)